jgi:hypothetical protein
VLVGLELREPLGAVARLVELELGKSRLLQILHDHASHDPRIVDRQGLQLQHVVDLCFL